MFTKWNRTVYGQMRAALLSKETIRFVFKYALKASIYSYRISKDVREAAKKVFFFSGPYIFIFSPKIQRNFFLSIRKWIFYDNKKVPMATKPRGGGGPRP